MTPNAATEASTAGACRSRKSHSDSHVASLSAEFPGITPCEIRVAVLQAEENLWPKKDAYILLDHAREILRGGPA